MLLNGHGPNVNEFTIAPKQSRARRLVQHEISGGIGFIGGGRAHDNALLSTMNTKWCLRPDTSGASVRDGVQDTIITLDATSVQKITKMTNQEESGRFEVLLASLTFRPHQLLIPMARGFPCVAQRTQEAPRGRTQEERIPKPALLIPRGNSSVHDTNLIDEREYGSSILQH